MRLIAIALVLVGCGTSAAAPAPSGAPMADPDDDTACRLTNGTTAAAGAIAPSTDGTNTCTCRGTHWSCTELAIHPGAAPAASGSLRAHYATDGTCPTTGGTVATVATTLPSDDGCNTCTCGPGGWECTEMACP